LHSVKQGAFAFRYTEAIPHLLLDTIGWQYTDSPNYGHEGHSRLDPGHVVFQFTLSGEGRIELDGQTHRLLPGMGFAVKVPSQFHYYYDDSSKRPWEFIWLNAKGEDANRMWDRLHERKGPIISLREASPALDRFWELYRGVSEEQLTEPTELSARLYRFILALLMPDGGTHSQVQSASIAGKAKLFMKEHVAQPLSLREIAEHCGVTGEYLCRLFRKHEAISPLEYLRRRRIETAVALLRSTSLDVREVGRQCGFESASYFGKTFKSYLGLSPSEFRSNKQAYPFDTIFLE
jgi:AraC-like DNA-binding protein